MSAITGFPGGVSSFGAVVAPGVMSALDKYWGGGQILWVGNRSGLPAGDGTDPEYPLSSLFGANGALAKLNATKQRGHVIFVLPGHAENISAADMASDTGAANTFAIVGLGKGDARPTFTWTAKAATWLLDTKNVWLDNLRLLMAGALGAYTAFSVTAPITISTKGCGIQNCDIKIGLGSRRWAITAISISGDDVVINNNRIIWDYPKALAKINVAATASASAIKLAGGDGTQITNNYMVAYYSGTTGALIANNKTANRNLLIQGNYIAQLHTKFSYYGVYLGASTHTGLIKDNVVVLGGHYTGANTHFIVQAASGNGRLALSHNFGVNTNLQRGVEVSTATT